MLEAGARSPVSGGHFRARASQPPALPREADRGLGGPAATWSPGLMGVINCLITMLAGALRGANAKRDHAIRQVGLLTRTRQSSWRECAHRARMSVERSVGLLGFDTRLLDRGRCRINGQGMRPCAPAFARVERVCEQPVASYVAPGCVAGFDSSAACSAPNASSRGAVQLAWVRNPAASASARRTRDP